MMHGCDPDNHKSKKEPSVSQDGLLARGNKPGKLVHHIPKNCLQSEYTTFHYNQHHGTIEIGEQQLFMAALVTKNLHLSGPSWISPNGSKSFVYSQSSVVKKIK